MTDDGLATDEMLSLARLGAESLRELMAGHGIVADSKMSKEAMLGALEGLMQEHGWTEAELFAGGSPSKPVSSGRTTTPVMLALSAPERFSTEPHGRPKRWEDYAKDFKAYLDALGPVPAAQQLSLIHI